MGEPNTVPGSGADASARGDSLGFDSRTCRRSGPGLLQSSFNDESAESGKRRYQRTWLAARRAAFFQGKACELCGGTDRLEIDHRDPATKTSHKIWSWSEERRAAELAKCRVLCHGCHAGRHGDERRKPLVHGTSNAFKKRGCRCDACRGWRNQYNADLKRAARAA